MASWAILAASVLILTLRPALAEDARPLGWPDLMPPGEVAPPPPWGHPPADDALFWREPQTGTFAVNPALDGVEAALSGFVVPLDTSGGTMTAFLLVPYYGACIHMPPPPPNQIVYGRTDTPLPIPPLTEAMNARGRLRAVRSDSPVGDAAYTMTVDQLE